MSFPSSSEIKKMRKKLNRVQGTLMLSPDATPLEKFRWDLCQKFIQYKKKHDLTQEELADLLGIDKAKVSKILRHRISDFSTDRLVRLYQKLNPKLRIKVG